VILVGWLGIANWLGTGLLHDGQHLVCDICGVISSRKPIYDVCHPKSGIYNSLANLSLPLYLMVVI